MALNSISVLILVKVVVVLAYDRVKMAQTPPVQPNFILEKVTGPWYQQYRLAPCSWAGSKEFDDWVVDQQIVSGDSLTVKETWRAKSGICSTISTRKTYQGDAYFTVKDPIGGVLTGESYNVATDYKQFNIVWGCAKRAVDGVKCDQPWVAVGTRSMHPSHYCTGIIRLILKKVWDLSISEMKTISHHNAC